MCLFRYGLLPSCGETEQRVPRESLRELSTMAGLRAKLAAHEHRARLTADKDESAAVEKTQDMYKPAVALPENLASSATINIAYAPAVTVTSAQQSLVAEQNFTGKLMIDTMSMFDEDTTDGLNAADFWHCLKEEGIRVHSHEKKHILKHYSKDDGSIEFKRLINDLAKITKLDKGHLVLSYHKGADKWLLAKITRAHSSGDEFDIEYIEVDSAGRLKRSQRRRAAAVPALEVYEEDPQDDADDAYAGEAYEDEQQGDGGAQAQAKGE